MLKLGFSLNDFYSWPKVSLEDILKGLNKNVPQAKTLELSHIYLLKDYLKNLKYLQKYDYLSFYLPKKGFNKCLGELNQYQDKLKLKTLIIHPNNSVNWQTISQSKIPVLIENMDNHKKLFKTEKEIKNLLSKYPKLNLCLDVNHLESNNLNLQAWLKKFRPRLKQIHLSILDNGYYQDSFKKKLRHALCMFNQDRLSTFKQLKKYPIILEGFVPTNQWHLVKREFNILKKILK